ncbi:hypothetical protein PV08_00411 [Exophiala spinifera]|uniref:RING-type domain-containing protein n=1 Tax=Exophiala spinifera TaxID=91928 RepID=A0A0D1YX04_9EURO|nr:uncharacterized protein PV08_00411 [Exophiala spinifera]KIW19836.1 hypothetical protein PV08_00411 [Exophiala spinifera]
MSSLFCSPSPQPSSTNNLHNQLLELERKRRGLKLKKSKLQDRIKVIDTLIADNINDARVKMKDLDASLAAEQAVKPFQTVLDHLNGNDEVVEGLCRQMQGDAALRIAVHAIANGRGTADHKMRVAAAVMTELAGDATQLIQNIATRAQQRVNSDVNGGDDDDENVDVDHGSQNLDIMSMSDDNPTFLHERVIRQPSLPDAMSSHRHLTSAGSPNVKSEEDSTSHQPTPIRATPSMYAAQANLTVNNDNNDTNTPSSSPANVNPARQYSSANMFAQPSIATAAMYASASSTTPVAAPTATAAAPTGTAARLAAGEGARTGVTSMLSSRTARTNTSQTQASVQPPASTRAGPPQAAGSPARFQIPDTASRMLRLESAFPGLLESINRPRPPPPAPKRPAPPPGPTPQPPERPVTPARPIKRNKTSKEAILQPAFVEFLVKLQNLHQSGKSIARVLRCCKCQNARRDVRVLSCLHLYCHKCIITLRNDASAGDALTGFKAACSVSDCKGAVSGKTSVIDGDIVDFLNWYDTQDAAVGTFASQIQVMKLALQKTPDDDDVRAKKIAVERDVNDAKRKGEIDTPVDLIKLVRLIRKPF